MWKILVDIIASALVGYCVEHSAEAIRQEAVNVLAHRFIRPELRRVHLVTYRQWVH